MATPYTRAEKIIVAVMAAVLIADVIVLIASVLPEGS